jgi:hypothetical protein
MIRSTLTNWDPIALRGTVETVDCTTMLISNIGIVSGKCFINSIFIYLT